MKPTAARTDERVGPCSPWRRIGVRAGLVILAAALWGVAPARADHCTDGDGDGFSPQGGHCGPTDCNDGDAAISPAAAEFCGDGIDNNCDGNVDFDKGAACGVADGLCVTAGTKQCLADGSGTFCQPNGPIKQSSPEGPTGAPSCFDGSDNDCDGLTDHAQPSCQGPEVCNGFDDDFDGTPDDGFGLGASCTVGVGFCERTGTVICKADHTGTQCSVSPGSPSVEGPPGGAKCSDGKDNDCDGTTDLGDTSCQSAEVCDGLDNDGNDGADEDFPDLGDACTVGLGECQASGVRVCKADGSGTVCSATPSLGSPEGPAGVTCSDGKDNDCDGTADAGDPSCNAAALQALCALPYTHGEHGRDCNGKHEIVIATPGAGPNAVVTAELLALDLAGNVLATLSVQDGEEAHLKSRTNQLHAVTKETWKGRRHELYAPIPLLRVTVEDSGHKAQAFCSNIPYLQVVEPRGAVITESEGDVTKVLAAIPLVDPSSLFLKVDGVDIFGALGIADPTTCNPSSPCGGVVVIGGQNVTVSDLIVHTGPVDVPASNTIALKLSGLGCGGHAYVVDGEILPGSFPTPHRAAKCHADDILDKGTSAVFAVDITSPTPGQITDANPTPVTGEVCHGRAIESVDVNGLSVPTAGQVFTPGDGEDSGDTYVLPINVALPRTNLAGDIAGQVTALGTFDRGSNRLIASATDDQANRTIKTLIFGVGGPDDFSSPGLTAAVQAQVQGAANAAIREVIGPLLFSTEIKDALVLGLGTDAMQTFFSSTCAEATEIVETKINEALKTKDFKPIDIPEPFFSCDLDSVKITVHEVRINGTVGCSVVPDPANNKLIITVALPPTEVDATAKDHCCTGCGFICLVEVTVDIDATTTISNMSVTFDITEEQITVGGQSEGHLNPGTVGFHITRDDSDIGCLVGAIADVLSFLANLFIEIFTLGIADPDIDLTPNFEGVFKEFDLLEKIGIIDFPLKVKEIKMNEQEIANSNQTLTMDLDTADVQAAGLKLALKATFAATAEDPDIADTPGAVKTPAPAPVPGGVAGAGNTFFVASDDILNQLFAAMTTQGELRTACFGSPKTVAELAPADCDSLPNFALRGGCKALKGVVCSTIEPDGERNACAVIRGIMQNRNITPTMKLLFCGRVDIPPQILIQDDGGTDGVETTLRMNDLFVGAVLDRNANGTLEGELASLPRCLQLGSDTSGDCKLVAACLDLNVATNLILDTPGGKLKMKPSVQGVSLAPRPPGSVCEGGINFGDVQFLQDTAASDPLADIQNDIDTLTPALQSDGLDLGGIVFFSNPRLIAVETDGQFDFQDYIGVTGDIVPNP